MEVDMRTTAADATAVQPPRPASGHFAALTLKFWNVGLVLTVDENGAFNKWTRRLTPEYRVSFPGDSYPLCVTASPHGLDCFFNGYMAGRQMHEAERLAELEAEKLAEKLAELESGKLAERAAEKLGAQENERLSEETAENAGPAAEGGVR
jgi:hypothetical protein